MNGYNKYLEFQYRWSGDFYTSLFRAIALADTGNTQRLSKGFPEEVDAYRIWTREGVEAFLEKVSPDHPLRDRFVKEYNLEVD
jgi:hypothetical protein